MWRLLVGGWLVAACGSAGNNAEQGVGGSATAGGGATMAGSAGVELAGSAGSSAGSSPLSGAGVGGMAGSASADPCPEERAPQREGGTAVDLTFVPTLGGKPFEVAQPVGIAGGQLTPLNLRFYVSEVSLEQADGSALPVDLLSPTGAVEPFGVHLVNFDDPASTTIHLKAPPGTYNRARFTLGLNDACNAGSHGRNAPLSASSEMVWPHLAGYLFLRYEAQWLAGEAPNITAAAPPPPMIHMGGTVGVLFAPQAAISGSLSVPADGTLARSVTVSFDEIFRHATSSEEVTNVLFSDPEIVAGERLRRQVPTAVIFELTDP